jgi:predicted signal transduction protein with EAL and GGDEF domain
MSDDSLIQAMPDVVAFVRSDGLITHHLGGRQVSFVHGSGSLAGRRLEEVFQPHVAALLARLVRRALAGRASCEAEFSVDGPTYQARVSAQGPRRALCVIRHVADLVPQAEERREGATPGSTERRGFVQRFQQSVALAALSERPLAICLIFLDGLTDIGRLIDFSIGERILTELLRQLPISGETSAATSWYVGQLGEGLLGVVIEGSVDREQVRTVVAALCDASARPVRVGDATFHIAPSAGIAILGQDAAQPAALLDHARAAMLEARRAATGTVQFYSDTLRMLPVARLDVERELRTAIEEGQIGLRYVARHELAGGRIVALQTYMRWIHPLRGEVPPSQFLPIADATGLALALSRAVLERLTRDLGALRARLGADVALSFGALRQHVASGQLLRDCRRLVPAAELAAGRFELRIAERTLATLSRPERALGEMVESGIRVVVDELGRGYSSLARLPRCPLWAVQIDRALVVAASRSAAALRSCRAIAALGHALEVVPIAAGVDNEATRARMIEIGCAQALGDLYPIDLDLASEPEPARAAG